MDMFVSHCQIILVSCTLKLAVLCYALRDDKHDRVKIGWQTEQWLLLCKMTYIPVPGTWYYCRYVSNKNTCTREGACLCGGHPVIGLSRSSHQRSSTINQRTNDQRSDQRPTTNDQRPSISGRPATTVCTVCCIGKSHNPYRSGDLESDVVCHGLLVHRQ